MKNRQYILGAGISYFAIFFNIAAGLIYTPWMVSQIGKSSYALYTLAGSFISIFMMDFGLSSAVSRFVAKYRAEGNDEKASALMGLVTKLYLLIDGVIFLVLLVVYFLLDSIYRGLTPSELEVYKTLYIIVGTYSLFSFPFTPLSGILNAYERIIDMKLCDLLSKIVTIALVVAALLCGYGVVAVVTANAVSGLVIIFVRLCLIRKNTPVRVKLQSRDRGLFREIFSFSIWVTVMSLAQRCIFNLAPTMLGVFSNSDAIAVFAPASTLEGYFYTFAAAINGIFLAKISRYIAQDRESEILELMIKVGRYQLVLLGLVMTGFVCIGRDFMLLWMGPDYVGAWPCALLIFIPDWLTYTQQIASTMATAKNKIKYVAIGYVGMAAICLLLSLLLCRRLGALGSAISIAAAYLFEFAYINIFVYHKQLHLDVPQFFKRCYGRTIWPILASMGIGYVLCTYVLHLSGWGGLIVEGLCVVALYAVLVGLFGFSRGEKKSLYGALRRRFS